MGGGVIKINKDIMCSLSPELHRVINKVLLDLTPVCEPKDNFQHHLQTWLVKT